MKTLVGSRAAKTWFSDWRTPKDTDYLISEDEPKVGDSHVAIGALKEFLEFEVAPPDYLYTLKVSHSFWDVHWWKTMKDIHEFQKRNVDFNEELFKKLYKVWEGVHGKKRAYLNVSNEEFFTPRVPRKYVHDSLHAAIAYNKDPMYKVLKKDPDKALLSKKMFNELSWEDKCKTAREEIYVTALERFLIPTGFNIEELTAYRRACKLLITSMSKGWFPKFIVLNWYELYRPDKHPWIELFHQGLNEGIVYEQKRTRRIN